MTLGQWFETLQRHVVLQAEQAPAGGGMDAQRVQDERMEMHEFLRDNPHMQDILLTLVTDVDHQADGSSTGTRSRTTVPSASGSSRSGRSSSGTGSDGWGLSADAQASSSGSDRNTSGTSSSRSSRLRLARGASAPGGGCGHGAVIQGLRARATTLTVHNVPRSCGREDLLESWPPDGSYDFLHLRRSASLARPARLVSINFTSPEHAGYFYARWQGQMLPGHRAKKPLAIGIAPVQGRDANLMLVLDGAPAAPVLLLGKERVSDDRARRLVRLAKAGVFMCTV